MGTPFHHAAYRLATFLLEFFQEDSKRKDNSFIGRLTRDFYVSETKRNHANELSRTITEYYLEQDSTDDPETDEFVCGKIKHLFRKTVNERKYKPASFEETLKDCEKAIDRLLSLFDELKLSNTIFISERRSSYEAINEMFFYIIENENKLFKPATVFDYVDSVLPCLNKLPIVDSYKHRTVIQPAEEKRRLALKAAAEINTYLDKAIEKPEGEGKDINRGLSIIENTLRLNRELKGNPGRLEKHLKQAQKHLEDHKAEFEEVFFASPPKRHSTPLPVSA